jgi:hypothetical protein
MATILDSSNAEFLIAEAKRKKAIIIFYIDTGEKYGSVKDFFSYNTHTADEISRLFIERKKNYPELKAGLEGDHIRSDM